MDTKTWLQNPINQAQMLLSIESGVRRGNPFVILACIGFDRFLGREDEGGLLPKALAEESLLTLFKDKTEEVLSLLRAEEHNRLADLMEEGWKGVNDARVVKEEG